MKELFVSFYQKEKYVLRLFTGFSHIDLRDRVFVIIDINNIYADLKKIILQYNPSVLNISLMFFEMFRDLFPLITEFSSVQFNLGGSFTQTIVSVDWDNYKRRFPNLHIYKFYEPAELIFDGKNIINEVNCFWDNDSHIISDLNDFSSYFIDFPLSLYERCYYGKCLFCDERLHNNNSKLPSYNLPEVFESFLSKTKNNREIHSLKATHTVKDLQFYNKYSDELTKRNIKVSAHIRTDKSILSYIENNDMNIFLLKNGLEYFSDTITNIILNKQEYLDNALRLSTILVKRRNFTVGFFVMINHFISDENIRNEVEKNVKRFYLLLKNCSNVHIRFIDELIMYDDRYLNDLIYAVKRYTHNENIKLNYKYDIQTISNSYNLFTKKNYIVTTRDKELDKFVLKKLSQIKGSRVDYGV